MDIKKPDYSMEIADVIEEYSKTRRANETLWIKITPLDKYGELSKIFIGKKPITLLYVQSNIKEVDSNSNVFSIAPADEIKDSGKFASLIFSTSKISEHSLIQICVHVDELKKGDEFVIFSSYYPNGFKNLKIEKYDLKGNLELIHEHDNLEYKYSTKLDWTWDE